MSAEGRPVDDPLVTRLITALAGLPVGLFTVTMEYGLATVACVASTTAELVAVCKSHASAGVDAGGSEHAEVIVLRGGGVTGRRT